MAKVLIAYASFGEGHKRGAYALEELADSSCCDLLDFSQPVIKKIYSLSYLFITQHFPYLWQVLFTLARHKFFFSLVDAIHRLAFSSFLDYLRKVKPKAIITTHFFPSSLAAIVKRELNFKLVSIVTDLRAHPSWVNPGIDHYYVASSAAKEDLLKLGVKNEKITAGFVPLRRGFLKSSSKENLYKKFSLGLRPSVVFVSSSRGNFPFFKKSIEALIKDFNVLVIYGKNTQLERYLRSLNSPRIRFFSFYEDIWDLISLSSVVIAKPGGLTVFESIYKRKPLIFTHYIRGQEKQNMDLLIKCGVAKFVQTEDELIRAVHYFGRRSDELRNSYPLVIKDIFGLLHDLVSEL